MSYNGELVYGELQYEGVRHRPRCRPGVSHLVEEFVG
jgi:hypothetical protein